MTLSIGLVEFGSCGRAPACDQLGIGFIPLNGFDFGELSRFIHFIRFINSFCPVYFILFGFRLDFMGVLCVLCMVSDNEIGFS